MQLIIPKIHYKTVLFVTMFLVGMLFAGNIIAAADYDREYPPALLIHEKIEKAGVPITGISFDEGKVINISFSEEATTEEKQAAWDIANRFDYQDALKEVKAGEGMITAYGQQIPQLTQDGQISVATVNGMPYIYFQAAGETHHILGSASFEISPKETIDALSGEKMQVGDFVIGMIDKSLDNGVDGQDSSMHGIWVKWSSVKKDLIEELKASLSGFEGGQVSGVSSTSLAQKFLEFGITLRDGIMHITQLAVDRFYAKTARIEKLELVDQATGEIYCTWIENGQSFKELGECDPEETEQPVIIQEPAINPVEDPTPTTEEENVQQEVPVTSEESEQDPEPTPEPEPEPEPQPEPEPVASSDAPAETEAQPVVSESPTE